MRLLKIAPATLALLLVRTVLCQTNSNINPTIVNTPAYSLGGAPAGSYALSGFDNINLYNGHLNFALPLVQIKGRGDAQFAVTLPIERAWTTVVPAGTSIVEPTSQFWYTPPPRYSPGLLVIREIESGGGSVSCGPPVNISHYTTITTRMTFVTAEGTETDFQDQGSLGQPLDNPTPCTGTGFNRGKTFVSTDGSAATFVSDNTIYDAPLEINQSGTISYPSGYLFGRNGVRYRIDNGFVTSLRERNGSTVTFSYDQLVPNLGRLTSIVDSLNRIVTFTHSAQPAAGRDDITFKGFGGAVRTISVFFDLLSNRLRYGQIARNINQLFPELNGSGTGPYDLNLPSYVQMPDGRQYNFYYDSYGELARVVLPTGGAVEYDYGPFGANGTNVIGSTPNQIIYRRLTERRTYPDGTTLEGRTHYTPSFSGSSPSDWNTLVFEDSYDLSNNRIARVEHIFYGNVNLDPFYKATPSGYSSWKVGRETSTEHHDAGGSVTRANTFEVTQRGTVGWWSDLPDLAPPLDPRLTKTTTILDDGQTSQQTFQYDNLNNLRVLTEYGYGQNAAGPAVRLTQTDFVTTNLGIDYTSPSGPHLRSLPSQKSVYQIDSSGTQTLIAQTSYAYDADAPLDRVGLSGHDTSYTSTYRPRGNISSVSRSLLQSSSLITDRLAYDVVGNVVSTTDPLLNVSTFDYSDVFGAPDGDASLNSPPSDLNGSSSFALRTSTRNALGQTTLSQYDYYLGAIVDAQDENGIVSSHYFNDPLDRPTKVLSAAGRSVASQTLATYNDSALTITTTSDQNTLGDALLRNDLLYDGFGRTTETRKYETSTTFISSRQLFDAKGRISTVFNPYRVGDPQASTVTTFDDLDRPVSVVAPDSATTTIAYSGNQQTTTDPSGASHVAISDALGRQTLAVEFLDPSHYYITTYAYDALDDLAAVVQGTSRRTYSYDSLGRLGTANNPESGTTTYSYDDNGNLTLRRDARGVSTTSGYDHLNRVHSRAYSDGTPSVTYTYDDPLVAFSTGRLTSMSSVASTASIGQYDPLGRALGSTQTTAGKPYSFSYSYNLAGALTSETYPSGRVINSSYDGANRTRLVVGVLGLNIQAYAGSVVYAPHGAVQSVGLGNGLLAQTGFHNRLQPTAIGLGTSPQSPTNIMGLVYTFNTPGQNDNNGNVLGQFISWPGATTLAQNYSYDGINRLTQATETSGSFSSWTQNYAYDQQGNRAVLNTSTYIPTPTLTPQSISDYDQTTNHWNGTHYDAAGNVTSDALRAFSYDAENRQIQFSPSGSPATTYSYDGNGKRVLKRLGASLTVYAYDVFGRLIGEYSVQASPAIGTLFFTSDHLGSIRAITDINKAVVSRHDYLPFGEDIDSSHGSRSSVVGYGAPDTVTERFTGKERDGESGLDYFGARYYSSGQGRFTGADRPFADQHPSNPQTWNLYSYSANNPLTFVDPTGRSFVSAVNWLGTHDPLGYFFNHAIGDITTGIRQRDPLAVASGSVEVIQNTATIINTAADIGFGLGALEGIAERAFARVIRNAGTIGEGENLVYRSINAAGDVNYVGITKNLEQRAAQQLGERGISIQPIPGLQNLSRADARAVEQVLIETHGLGSKGGSLLNKINSISPSNAIYQQAVQRGTDLLRQVEYLKF